MTNKLPIEILNELIRKLQIVDVFLSSSDFKLNMHPKEIKPENARINIDTNSKIEFSPDKSLFFCHVTRILNVFPKDAQDNIPTNSLAFLSTTFSLVYLVKNNPEEAPLNAYLMFAETNAEFNSYSYFREYIQSTFSRAGMIPFVLPFYIQHSVGAINEKYKNHFNESEMGQEWDKFNNS